MKDNVLLSWASTPPFLLNSEVKMFADRKKNIHFYFGWVEILWKGTGASSYMVWTLTEESNTVFELCCADLAKLTKMCFSCLIVSGRIFGVVLIPKPQMKISFVQHWNQSGFCKAFSAGVSQLPAPPVQWSITWHTTVMPEQVTHGHVAAHYN